MDIQLFDIQDPVYKQNIKFCLGGDSQQLLELVKSIDGGLEEDPGEFESGIVLTNRIEQGRSPTFWIWVKRFRSTVYDYSFLAHECVHLLQSLLDWLEIDMSDETTEPCASLYEYIFGEILKILRKQRTRKRG